MSKTQTGALLTFFALTFGWTWGLWAIVALQELGLTGLGGVEDRNFKRCFSGPWPGCVGHLGLARQRSE